MESFEASLDRRTSSTRTSANTIVGQRADSVVDHIAAHERAQALAKCEEALGHEASQRFVGGCMADLKFFGDFVFDFDLVTCAILRRKRDTLTLVALLIDRTADERRIHAVVEKLAGGEHRFSTLIVEVVHSYPFSHRKKE